MNKELYQDIIKILEHELVPALGCTEPGSVALCAAQAASLLGTEPETLEVWCSGNIVKNVKGVIVPNSGGMRGIDAAAILGALIASSNQEDATLEILTFATEEDIKKAHDLVDTDYCKCHLAEDKPNLYIKVKASAGNDNAEVVIQDGHTNITSKVLNGEVVFDAASLVEEENVDDLKKKLSVKEILAFADELKAEDVAHIFDRQIEANTAIAEEGITNKYGACVGQTILNTREKCAKTSAVAKAAAGSDARMNGCILPVVINSGSGNQGITITVPIVEMAKSYGMDQLGLYKGLAVGNLISIHIKSHIGKLSAFCGAVSAACGSGCGIAYMDGASYEEICGTIANALGNVGGIVCDGAKASCAAKIASSLDAALLGYDMAKSNLQFQAGEGLVEADIEDTIDNIGMMGKHGMKSTDVQILHLMLGNKDFVCC